MTEEEARDWICERFGAEAEARLAIYVDLLRAGASSQNLIAPSTLASIWSRHIVDSAQLIPMARGVEGLWIDIGSGAGLPGIVVAVLRQGTTILVEPRRARAEFLEHCCGALALNAMSVRKCRADAIIEPAAVISARAVAGIGQIFAMASQCASADTLWLLPRGESGLNELEAIRKSWHGMFHVEQSVTQAASHIVIARGVHRK